MKFPFIYLLLLPCLLLCQENIDGLYKKLRSPLNVKDKILVYKDISEYYQHKHADLATQYAIKGLNLAHGLNDKHAEGQMFYQLGNINTIQGNFQTARLHFTTALNIFTGINDKEGSSHTYMALGILESKNKNVNAATNYFFKAMHLYRITKNLPGAIQCYIELGNMHEVNGNGDKAMSYYKEAERLNNDAMLPDIHLSLLDQMGKVYLNKGEFDKAMQYFEQGIRQSDTVTHVRQLITFFLHTGEAYEKAGNYNKAIIYYKNALLKAKQSGLPEAQARMLIKMASALKGTDPDTSLAHLKIALSLAKQISYQKLTAEIYKAMSEIHKQQGHYNDALFTLEEQHKLLDNLSVINKAQEAEGLQAKEDIEKLQVARKKIRNERNISITVILTALIILLIVVVYSRRLRTINRRLKESNQVKDTLFSIIGHDLRGPMSNAIQSMEIMETANLSQKEQQFLVSGLKKQSEASFEILNALLSWGNIQMQGVKINSANFQPSVFINKNIQLLSSQAKNKSIALTNKTPVELNVFADSDQFDFIIRNLLSNAIKFSYANSEIEINADPGQKVGFVIFSVKDSGAGISVEQQKQFLESNMSISYGTGGEKGTGLGLLLIKEFVRANGGKVWLESQEKKGTTFYFSLRKTE